MIFEDTYCVTKTSWNQIHFIVCCMYGLQWMRDSRCDSSYNCRIAIWFLCSEIYIYLQSFQYIYLNLCIAATGIAFSHATTFFIYINFEWKKRKLMVFSITTFVSIFKMIYFTSLCNTQTYEWLINLFFDYIWQ